MAIPTPNNQQYNRYLETQVQTASPIQLICMLYDGAIKFSNLALAGIKEQNIEKKTVNIIKVENIVNELRVSLDFEKGGEIAKNLDKLYDYMYITLMEANSNDDAAKIENVVKMLVMLRESWYAIAKNPQQASSPQAQASSPQPSQPQPVAQKPVAKPLSPTYSRPVAQPAGKDKLDLAC